MKPDNVTPYRTKLRKLLSILITICLPSIYLFGCTNSRQNESSDVSKTPAFVLKQPDSRNITVNDPNTSLKGITNLRAIEMMTGEDSINKTRTNYNIAGCDLGIFIQHKDRVYLAFGDTFSGDGDNNMIRGWRSNTLAYTTDFNAADGIKFDGMICNAKVKDKKAIELLSSQKLDNVEMTVIPTGGFSSGNDMYIAFMSVKHWGQAGDWDVNYGGFAKSTDDGQSWQKLNNLKWTDKSFGQLCPLVVDDYVYIYGIPGGRNGGLKIMRVKAANFERFEDYEYMTGTDNDGNPIFKKGDPANAAVVVPPQVGEPSVVYNSYLHEYLLTYLSGDHIGLRASRNPWGPWSNYVPFVSSADYPGLYGGFMSPVYTGSGGKTVYFTMSIWGNYNVALMSIDLNK